ncbi:MAG: hypothetical protein NWE98_01400 [Candidatus Bathyarchaeota archaeon]|nr:hypothetical protein [Candidatus Bathyarchaeota archaeon]
MNRLIGTMVAIVVVICVLTAFLTQSSIAPPDAEQKELDFSVSGKNDCLRFLNPDVQTVYIPFRTGANELWQLTINATVMPGGANGSTDLYIYRGYWDKGADHKCVSKDVYSILADIESANTSVTGSTPYSGTFGGPSPESYTVFFIFPPGGEATFHITLKRL